MIGLFATLLAGLLPTYIVRFSLVGIPTNIFECAVVVACSSIFLHRFSRTKAISSLQKFPRKYLFPIGLFIVAACISTIISSVPIHSLGILKGWIVVPALFGALVYIACTSDSKNASRISTSLIVSGVVTALLGISQIHGSARVSAIYDVPNSLALFLVPIAVFAYWIAGTKKNRLYLFFAVVMSIGIIATQSASALIALIAAISVGRFFQSRTLILLIAIGGTCILLGSGRIQYLLHPLFHTGATNSATVRLQLWDISTRIIAKHPLLGVGLGQFEGAYQAELHRRFAQEKAKEANAAISYKLQPEYVFRDPHNFILSFWLNVGVLGLWAFLVMNILAFGEYKNAPGPALALCAMLIFGLFDTIYWKNDLSALWWGLLALIIATSSVQKSSLTSVQPPRSPGIY